MVCNSNILTRKKNGFSKCMKETMNTVVSNLFVNLSLVAAHDVMAKGGRAISLYINNLGSGKNIFLCE